MAASRCLIQARFRNSLYRVGPGDLDIVSDIDLTFQLPLRHCSRAVLFATRSQGRYSTAAAVLADKTSGNIMSADQVVPLEVARRL